MNESTEGELSNQKGGVSVYVPDPDQPGPRVVEVEHICVGCGELIDKFEAFEDTVDKDARPIHDSLECRRLAIADEQDRDKEVESHV